MKKKIAACLLVAASAANAAEIPECNFSDFPTFWADAEERVGELKALLGGYEKKYPFSQSSSAPFKQSLRLCAAKRESMFKGATVGSGGIVSQTRCEAILICARIYAIGLGG